MAANTPRLRIGASDIVYAVLNEASDVVGGTPTWGTPVSLPNAKAISFDPGSSLFTGFYDDGAKFSADTVGVLKLQLTLGDITPTAEAEILGHTYTGGQIQQTTLDQAPYVAVGWKTLRTGTSVYDFYWLYKGKFRKPTIDAKTKEATITPTDVVLEGNFVGLTSKAGLYANKLRTDDDAAAAATITGFFTTVPLATANLNALTVTAAEGTAGDAKKIVYTFAKTGGASFSIAPTTITTTTCPCYVAGALKAGAYVVGAAGTTVVVKFTPTSAFTSAQVVTCPVTAGAKDTDGVGATPYSVAITIA
jgi:phi13 family phage major tail protein